MAAQTSAKTMALVIGNANYSSLPRLGTPLRDAELIAERLSQLGVEVVLLRDLDRLGFLTALVDFQNQATNSDQVIFYFAGHGVHGNGQSHLLPTDANTASAGWQETAIPLGLVLRMISDRPRQKLLFIDACRDIPNASTLRTRHADTASLAVQAGTLISYSAQPGAQASDGTSLNSPFAASLAQALIQGPRDMEQAGRRIRLDVIRATGGRQVPWSRSSLLKPAIVAAGQDLTE